MSSLTDGGLNGATSNDHTGKSNNKIIYSCASCGIKEDGDIKLKICTACKSVRYCGVECQKKHRPKHKKDCKKRAAELRDELLFKQPESTHLGDCPICCLPLPYDILEIHLYECCSQCVCNGCVYANMKREDEQRRGERKCPFCRSSSVGVSLEKLDDCRMKRVKVNCPVALRETARAAVSNNRMEEALTLYNRAAKMGDACAQFELGSMYEEDTKKAIKLLEAAAIGGHPQARLFLATEELKIEKIKRALDHLVIGTKQGCVKSKELLEQLAETFNLDEDFCTDALLGYQAAVDATKSAQREEAEVYFKQNRSD